MCGSEMILKGPLKAGITTHRNNIHLIWLKCTKSIASIYLEQNKRQMGQIEWHKNINLDYKKKGRELGNIFGKKERIGQKYGQLGMGPYGRSQTYNIYMIL